MQKINCFEVEKETSNEKKNTYTQHTTFEKEEQEQEDKEKEKRIEDFFAHVLTSSECR
jgi:hypothetical protein